MAEKVKRSLITDEQKEALKASFLEGMTSVSSPLVLMAAEATGLTPDVIKNWIGNHKRVLNPPSTSTAKPPPKAKLHTRAVSGYNLFIGEHLQNSGTKASLKEINCLWSSLDDGQKSAYRSEAAAVEAAGRIKPLSPEQRELKIQRHLRQLKIEVAGLEVLGVETMALAFDRQKADLAVHEVGSRGATDFLNSTDTSDNFALHFKASSMSSATKETPGDVVKRVQDLFNQKYKEAGGHGSVPYKSLKDGKVVINVTGLPDGLSLIKPSHYGRHQLEKVLKAAEQMSFEIIEQCGEEPVNPVQRPSGSPVMTAVDDGQLPVEPVDTDKSNTVVVLTPVDDGQCSWGPMDTSTTEAVQPAVGGPTSEGRSAVEIALESMCDDGQCSSGPMDTSSTVAVQPAVGDGQMDPPSYYCSICNGDWNDAKLNSILKWRDWRECTECDLWTHRVCGFKNSLCKLCQEKKKGKKSRK